MNKSENRFAELTFLLHSKVRIILPTSNFQQDLSAIIMEMLKKCDWLIFLPKRDIVVSHRQFLRTTAFK